MRRLLVLALALIPLIAACTPSFPTARATPATATPAGLTWHACSSFECATLQVPLDYSHPEAGTLDLALIRLKATNPANRIGSLLLNPGGPGASGVQFLRDASFGFGTLRARFDLVSFDPRGIGDSTSVHCPPTALFSLDTFNALDPVLDDPAEKQAVISADQGFAAACKAGSGSLLPYVSTVATARDMDQIRIALGDPKLTYLGFSYGTYMGLLYASFFPTHIRALALDGVFDPSLDANSLLLAQLKGFDDNLQAFLSDCRAHAHQVPLCTYAANGDPQTKLDALMSTLDAQPLPVGDRSLTRALAVIGVLTPRYSRSSWPQLDAALAAASKDDGSPLLALSDSYLGRNPDGTYNNEEEAGLAINCLDRPVPASVSAYDALASTFNEASPFFGPAFLYSNLACAYWPVSAEGLPAPITTPGLPPLLLIGGTHDPATPYAWAQSVHAALPSSVLLTRDGYGHTSYFASACAEQAIDAYLISLTLPTAAVPPCS